LAPSECTIAEIHEAFSYGFCVEVLLNVQPTIALGPLPSLKFESFDKTINRSRIALNQAGAESRV
jgi:hypothetical protein